ncbi:MAG TPA: hypothetical protein VLZ50_01945 [Terracidiphilus sp.]|nr:hypothetical protein [Terracidiphilus sp.]
MADERAGIYFTQDAAEAFYELPEESQRRLADFLESERSKLEMTRGETRDGLAAEWEPGGQVFWQVRLKPKYRARRKGIATPGAVYRIEVLAIRKAS